MKLVDMVDMVHTGEWCAISARTARKLCNNHSSSYIKDKYMEKEVTGMFATLKEQRCPITKTIDTALPAICFWISGEEE